MSNSLSNIGLSGINAAQYGLTTTGQNISSASTPGYNRESVLLRSSDSQYTGSGYLGTGVSVDTVKRAYSDSLASRLNTAQSTGSALSTYNTEAKSLNAVVGDPSAGISSNLTQYFAAAQALSTDPSDAAARGAMMGAASNVVGSVHSTATQMNAMRASVNGQIDSAVTDINAAAKNIAHLNHQIAAESASGQAPNSLLDQRDTELNKLSGLVNVNMTKQSDGSYSVFTGTGQPLVLGGQTFSLSAVKSPTDGSELTIGYAGANGAEVGGGPGGHEGYLSEASLTGGKLGGLMSFRSQMLDPAQSQLGKIAAAFGGAINDQNKQGLDINGAPGKDLFDLGKPTVTAHAHNSGNATLSANIGDTHALTGDNYTLSYDGHDYTLKNLRSGSETNVANWPATVDGVEYKLNGAMRAGDSFAIAPTRSIGTSMSMTTEDGGAIAAATPVVTGAATGNKGTGTITLKGLGSDFKSGSNSQPVTLQFHSAIDPSTGMASASVSGFPPNQDVTVSSGSGPDATHQVVKSPVNAIAFKPGATLSFGGQSIVLNGTPKNGDTFVIARNSALSGDGSNALKMGNLQNAALVGSNTLTQSYSDYVGQVGVLASQTALSDTTQSTLVNQLKTQQQSVSGVNLDEEAANLMQYQQMYQANSKVIQTAGNTFDTILDLVK